MADTGKLKQATWSMIPDRYFHSHATISDNTKRFILGCPTMLAQDIAGSCTCSGIERFGGDATFSSYYVYSNGRNYRGTVAYKATSITYPPVFMFASMAAYSIALWANL